MTHWRTTLLGVCGLVGSFATGVPLILKGKVLEGVSIIGGGFTAFGIGWHAADKRNSITVEDR